MKKIWLCCILFPALAASCSREAPPPPAQEPLQKPVTLHLPASMQARQRGIATVFGKCAPPAALSLGSEPMQSPLPKGMGDYPFNDYRLKPLFGFSVDATVMSRHDYSDDREADLAPIDLALGWGKMRDDAIIKALHVSQANRWYRYQWIGKEPLPAAEIISSSANMHMIPSDLKVLQALQTLKSGDDVRIDGWLVEARGKDGWRWRSSVNRGDTGQGGCEVIYVCAVTPVPRSPQ